MGVFSAADDAGPSTWGSSLSHPPFVDGLSPSLPSPLLPSPSLSSFLPPSLLLSLPISLPLASFFSLSVLEPPSPRPSSFTGQRIQTNLHLRTWRAKGICHCDSEGPAGIWATLTARHRLPGIPYFLHRGPTAVMSLGCPQMYDTHREPQGISGQEAGREELGGLRTWEMLLVV